MNKRLAVLGIFFAACTAQVQDEQQLCLTPQQAQIDSVVTNSITNKQTVIFVCTCENNSQCRVGEFCWQKICRLDDSNGRCGAVTHWNWNTKQCDADGTTVGGPGCGPGTFVNPFSGKCGPDPVCPAGQHNDMANPFHVCVDDCAGISGCTNGTQVVNGVCSCRPEPTCVKGQRIKTTVAPHVCEAFCGTLDACPSGQTPQTISGADRCTCEPDPGTGPGVCGGKVLTCPANHNLHVFANGAHSNTGPGSSVTTPAGTTSYVSACEPLSPATGIWRPALVNGVDGAGWPQCNEISNPSEGVNCHPGTGNPVSVETACYNTGTNATVRMSPTAFTPKDSNSRPQS